MTDDPVVLLREAADKATAVPWEQNGMNGIHDRTGGCIALTYHDNRKANAAFIVAARNHLDAVLAEVVRLRAQVEAVRQIHQPLTEITSALGEPETTWTRCSHGCNPLVWPCSTIRALGGSDD